MLSLWTTFWGEFREQSVFNQIAFLLPFIGIPTLIGVFTGWSTKARLRKALEGRNAEIRLLTEEVADLRDRSFQYQINELERGDANCKEADFISVFNKNKRDLAIIAEHIANEQVIRYWTTSEKSHINDACYFARIALSVNPGSVVGRSILALNFKVDDYIDDNLRDQIAGGERIDVDVIRQSVLIMVGKINGLISDERYDLALQLARFNFLLTSSQDLTYSDVGYNALYGLVRALLLSCKGARPAKDKEDELTETLSLWKNVVDSCFGDPDHLAQFVSKFHFATAQQLFGNSEAALNVLEDEHLPQRVGPCIGEHASASFAIRHLYANLLYEQNRPKDAERVVELLSADLKSAGLLSKDHVRTYQSWAAQAASTAYKSGKSLRFHNKGYLTY